MPITSMNPTKTTLYSLLIALTIIAMLLVSFVALHYSYSSLSAIESGAGFLILFAVAASLWFYRNRASHRKNPTERNGTIIFGIILGLLWMIEISINNFIAPPLPARDIIDNIFWAIIAFSILVLSVTRALQKDSLMQGIEAGIWSGFVSGLLACCMGLLVVVFGMHFILQDPLNVSEWVGRGAGSNAPRMAAYFAFETFAGAFGHLIVLGVAMGALLGVLGGSIGKGVKRIVGIKRE
jgi:hypothetical protein